MGNFIQKGSKKYIVYKEYTGEILNDCVVNTLKIEGNDDCAVLIKNNSKQTRMIFEKNRRHYCPYSTDLGAITFGVFTNDISFSGNEASGNLNLRYTLDMNSSLISSNELNIKFRKVK